MSTTRAIRIHMAPRPIRQKGNHVTKPSKVPEAKRPRQKRKKRAPKLLS